MDLKIEIAHRYGAILVGMCKLTNINDDFLIVVLDVASRWGREVRDGFWLYKRTKRFNGLINVEWQLINRPAGPAQPGSEQCHLRYAKTNRIDILDVFKNLSYSPPV